jgi:hypothetical protein
LAQSRFIIEKKRNFDRACVTHPSYTGKGVVIPMAEVQKYRLSICGSEYTISTDEPAGYMQELAAQVDTGMRNLLNSNEARYTLTNLIL